MKRRSARASRASLMTLALVAVFPGAIAHAPAGRLEDAAIPVKYAEGMVHGFLELSTEAGAPLAHGDLLQVHKDGGIASRMVFHFGNASVFEETVSFTQREVFTMQAYHLVQSGPAFAEDLDASLSRSGSYVVKTKSHKDGEEHRYTGTLALTGDVYNGMMAVIAKNIPTREITSVHIVAFTPQPRVIKIDLVPSGSQRVLLGKHAETAVEFVVKAKLGALLKMGAKLTGKLPPDSRLWIITDDVPAFVRSEGPLYAGPVWRIALESPAWPK